MKRLIVLAVFVVVGAVAVVHMRTASISLGGKAFRAEVADEADEWTRGLSGRETLAADGAMLFVFPDAAARTFWMKDMRFPIDIIWLKDDAVVGIVRNVQPEPGMPDALLTRYFSPVPVDAVLEVPAGAADGLAIGDILEP